MFITGLVCILSTSSHTIRAGLLYLGIMKEESVYSVPIQPLCINATRRQAVGNLEIEEYLTHIENRGSPGKIIRGLFGLICQYADIL